MPVAIPCPLIEVAGPPFERGHTQGRQAADRIRRGIAHYMEQLGTLSAGRAELAAIVRDYLPKIEAFDSHYVEEMRGIASGADVPFDCVVLLNARTEVLQLAKRAARGDSVDEFDEPDGCTCAVVLPEAARDRRLLHGHNWDWKLECADTCIVLRVRSDDGPDYLTFTEAGALARFGINSVGITLSANYLESDRDYTQVGVPLALLRRKVLEEQLFALSLRAVYTTPKSTSNNVTVCHAAGMAFNFECAPDEAFMVEPQAGLLVHANHWLSPVALTKLRDRGIGSMPCTLYRQRRVTDLLTPRVGAITPENLVAALSDDFAAPWSVCRPPRPSISSNLTATVAMLVMDPARGQLNVAMLPALGRSFTSYSLEMESTAL